MNILFLADCLNSFECAPGRSWSVNICKNVYIVLEPQSVTRPRYLRSSVSILTIVFSSIKIGTFTT